MFPISILPTRRTHVLVPLLPTAAPQLQPGPPQPPHALPSASGHCCCPRLPPPPKRLPPRPPRHPRARQAPEPARSRLRPAGSPPGPARALPAAQRFPPRRRRREGRARRACHGGRLTVRLRSRARLRHDQAAGLGERGWAGKRRPGLLRAQLAEEASTEPPPPPPREEPLRLEPPAPPQPRAETDLSADLRLLILTAGNKRCAGAGGWGGT